MGRSGSGKKKRAAVLGFLGFATTAGAEEDDDQGQGAAGWLLQPGRQETSSKVRPSDEDGFVDGWPWWYAERDIDRRASEFIDRVHRGIARAAASDGPSSASSVPC